MIIDELTTVIDITSDTEERATASSNLGKRERRARKRTVKRKNGVVGTEETRSFRVHPTVEYIHRTSRLLCEAASTGSSEAAAVVTFACNSKCDFSEPLSNTSTAGTEFSTSPVASNELISRFGSSPHASYTRTDCSPPVHDSTSRLKRTFHKESTWVRGSKRLRTDIGKIVGI